MQCPACAGVDVQSIDNWPVRNRQVVACLRGLLARGAFSTVAGLHDLDDAFSKGQPLKCRLLAQRASAAPPLPDPAAALHAVIGHLAPLSASSHVPRG